MSTACSESTMFELQDLPCSHPDDEKWFTLRLVRVSSKIRTVDSTTLRSTFGTLLLKFS